MIPITRKLLTHTKSRPALRDRSGYLLDDLRAIVMHWTANTARGADALANRNYFNLGSRYASAHYIVDDHSIIQCIPDNEVAYHVGAKRYKPVGNMLRENSRRSPNHFTIGIEMCVNSDGDWYKTYQNSVDLTAFLFLKHLVPEGCVFRHYDVTGKDCPRMMLDPVVWEKFENDVTVAMLELRKEVLWRGRMNTKAVNLRTGPGMEHPVIGQMYFNEPCLVFDESGNWLRIEPNGWVFRDLVCEA